MRDRTGLTLTQQERRKILKLRFPFCFGLSRVGPCVPRARNVDEFHTGQPFMAERRVDYDGVD